jgi:peptidase C39-like protein
MVTTPSALGPPDAPRAAYRRLDLSHGEPAGCAPAADGLTLAQPQGTYEYADIHGDQVRRGYEYATWVGPPVAAPFPFAELVPSWSARTPPGSWVEVCVRVRPLGGRAYSRWYVVARWTTDPHTLRPASVAQQSDPVGWLDGDTFHALEPAGCDAWQLRVTLLRPIGGSARPVLRYAGALVSTAPGAAAGPSAPGPYAGKVLDVPGCAARSAAARYPQWPVGPEVWCGPAAVAMVLDYWGTGPGPEERDGAPGPDGAVPQAVRRGFDYARNDAANRSFLAAYAAGFGLEAFVTRLRDLTEVEELLAAGIPVIAWLPPARRPPPAGEPTGGHAAAAGDPPPAEPVPLVLAGCTPDGLVVVNDPGAVNDAAVRRTVRRHDLETAWLTGTGGLAHILHPPSAPLPPRRADGSW